MIIVGLFFKDHLVIKNQLKLAQVERRVIVNMAVCLNGNSKH